MRLKQFVRGFLLLQHGCESVALPTGQIRCWSFWIVESGMPFSSQNPSSLIG